MIPLLLQKVKAKGYRIFTEGLYNVNIIGVRRTDEPGKFDDTIALVYKDSQGWVCREWPATTDPTVFYLNKPVNVKGTAALVPGQYKAWKIDKHNGRIDALCQRLSKVKVYRDNNKNDIFEWDQYDNEEYEGWYGINIHDCYRGNEERASAGCQIVGTTEREFANFMQIIKMSADIYGNAFTYTLLEEKDV